MNENKNPQKDIIYILRQEGWDSTFSKIEALDKKIKENKKKKDNKDNSKED